MEQNSQQFFSSVFLAGQQPEPSQDYQPYFHIRGYLRQKYRQSGKTVPELAQACGYRKLEKFKRHMEAWLKATRPVPGKFLGAIGVEPEMLMKVQVLDFDSWEEAVKSVGAPLSFSARYMPAVWQSVPLPENLNEAQAVSYVKDFARLRNRQCLINYSGLRVTWIDPDGSSCRHYNWPAIEYKNRLVYFKLGSAQPGTTRLAR
ncbi:hypothetical protein HZA73_07145 [candidate division TA06 bacterium]|nr:hypothetical protein [candidate division TA06 bacterium]